jgi:hypothetical protein
MKNAAGGANRAAAFNSDSSATANLLSEPPAQSNSSGQLDGDGILIARFWKSARNRREAITLTLKSYEGHPYLDCRLFAATDEGRSLPTTKGVTVGIKQLPEFLRAVDKAYTRARDLGLIEGSSC